MVIKDKSAIPALKIVMEKDANPDVREAARLVIEKLEKAGN